MAAWQSSLETVASGDIAFLIWVTRKKANSSTTIACLSSVLCDVALFRALPSRLASVAFAVLNWPLFDMEDPKAEFSFNQATRKFNAGTPLLPSALKGRKSVVVQLVRRIHPGAWTNLSTLIQIASEEINDYTIAMTAYEKQLLQGAIETISDPNGNWNYAWTTICKMADLDPEGCVAPFRRHPLDGFPPLPPKPKEN